MPFGELCEEGMNQVRHHETDKMRPSGHQSASDRIRLIVQFLDSLEDALTGFVADIFVIAQHLGNRNDRHAKIACNVL